MLRKLNLLFIAVVLTVGYSFSQSGLGSVVGSVIDGKTNEVLEGVTIFLKQGDNIVNKARTDMDGNFKMNSVSAGKYDVEFKFDLEGYTPSIISGVIVSADKFTPLDKVTLNKPKKSADGVQEEEEVVVKVYAVKLIDPNGGTQQTVTREEISKLPVRNAAGVASTVGGVGTNEGSGEMSIRGSKSDATYFYIDGIKVRGSSNLPKSAIEEVSVMTGGLPANYGDATGGIISVTTRGPSSSYFGSAELVSSGFYVKGKDANGYDGKVYGLDKYGYNLAEGMLSGPLWMIRDSTGKKTNKPRLGFLVSLNYTDQLDSRPLANGGGYRVKKEVRDELLANPLRPQPDGKVPLHAANFLHKSDFEQNPWRMNARTSVISANGKLDVRTGPTMNLTFGGSLNYGYGNQYSYTSSLLNFTNFGYYTSLDWRVYGRLSQRFVNRDPKSSSKIKGAYYTLMVDYSQSQYQNFDKNHKFNAFGYGHVGEFRTTQVPTYTLDYNTLTSVQNGFKDQEVAFTPSQSNSALAAITTQYYSLYANDPIGHYENLFQIQQGNALRNGDQPASVYDIWSNIGTAYNYMGKSENSQFRVTGSGSLNLGNHDISLGFEYEQRFDRGWGTGDYGPIGIWQIARQLTNFHLRELDLSSGDTVNVGNFQQVSFNRLNSGYAYSHSGIYGGQENKDNQSFFDYNLRNKLNLVGGGANSSYVDLDRLDPSLLSIDMFSPDELLNNGNTYISYYGYDISGEKVRGKTDINSYFNDYDANGNFQRKIGAFQPIYVAGYLMDKFRFSDLVFNVGVRVDVFDANQPVLKDPYLFYNARTVSEAKELATKNSGTYPWVTIPSSIGDDYVVYVNDVKNPTAINGFRNGSTWYNAEGNQVDDPKLIRGASGIAPWLIDPNNKVVSASSFENYKPQVNVMPRLSFSFPISDEALFFAHYDILTKRPTNALRFDPTEYQFIAQTSSPLINNPNLKPETTIDYELGFQQVLSKTSSIKISAFYREQRNNVQLINVFDAYPNSYKTYGNRDFGTVKGLIVSYDLRRTGNIRMTANYTLQFAEGTGTDATSAAAFINAGLPNLRNIFPYDFDTRHQFNIVTDYRYGEGKDYNGPMLGDFALFENTGLNLITNIYSGSPYSSQTNITNAASTNALYSGMTGTLNGSRKPWSYRLDIQLDRTINIDFKQKDGKSKSTSLNIYVRATNLLNQFNVINVYRATGNWNDDGYLAAAQFQQSIQNQFDEQSFRDYYTMKVQNAFNISSPRTIRLGVKFDF